jgi:hypothetical protein
MVKLPYRSRFKNRSTGSGYKPGGSHAWFSHLSQCRKFRATVSSAKFAAIATQRRRWRRSFVAQAAIREHKPRPLGSGRRTIRHFIYETANRPGGHRSPLTEALDDKQFGIDAAGGVEVGVTIQ